MMATNKQPRWFAELIREEGLDDPSAFLDDGYFEEIPFYSRYDQLPPAGPGGRFEADGLLIKSCLGYLDQMLTMNHSSVPLLAAITVVQEGKDDPIVPSVFVCCGDDRVHSILAGLALIRARSSLGLYLERLLGGFCSNQDYGLLQDSVTVPGQPRIFIARRNPPSPGVLGLDRLRRGSSPRSGNNRPRK